MACYASLESASTRSTRSGHHFDGRGQGYRTVKTIMVKSIYWIFVILKTEKCVGQPTLLEHSVTTSMTLKGWPRISDASGPQCLIGS